MNEGDENIERLLRENHALLEENNKILHKLHRYQQWSRALRVIYWLVILGSIFGTYFFLQQYLVALGISPETIQKVFQTPNQFFLEGLGGDVTAAQ